jgi:hypothetical protein
VKSAVENFQRLPGSSSRASRRLQTEAFIGIVIGDPEAPGLVDPTMFDDLGLTILV